MFAYIADLLGVAIFAVTGALAAGRKKMDLLGVLALATVTAIGGGTLRDLLLDRHPIFWLQDHTSLGVIVAAALLTVAYTRRRPPPRNALALADAFGLAVFGIMGAQIAETSGLTGIMIVLMGTITGAAGGVIRDALSAKIPLIFRQGELYATAAIGGTGVYLLLTQAGLHRPAAALIGMAVIILVRVASIPGGLKLPAFKLREE